MTVLTITYFKYLYNLILNFSYVTVKKEKRKYYSVASIILRLNVGFEIVTYKNFNITNFEELELLRIKIFFANGASGFLISGYTLINYKYFISADVFAINRCANTTTVVGGTNLIGAYHVFYVSVLGYTLLIVIMFIFTTNVGKCGTDKVLIDTFTLLTSKKNYKIIFLQRFFVRKSCGNWRHMKPFDQFKKFNC